MSEITQLREHFDKRCNSQDEKLDNLLIAIRGDGGYGSGGGGMGGALTGSAAGAIGRGGSGYITIVCW